MEDLSAILGAITENASRHARRQVRISARKQATHAVLSVLDDGPGIPPDKIDTLMRRGVREDETGTGLGLAIARELTEALGGSLELISRDPGLMVRITLPLAAT
nr:MULTISPECIES: ATP-binding protein [Ruegeria]